MNLLTKITPTTLATEKLKPHWTDSHIKWDATDGMFVSYDEAGMEHSRNRTLNDARDNLVIYSYILEQTDSGE